MDRRASTRFQKAAYAYIKATKRVSGRALDYHSAASEVLNAHSKRDPRIPRILARLNDRINNKNWRNKAKQYRAIRKELKRRWNRELLEVR